MSDPTLPRTAVQGSRRIHCVTRAELVAAPPGTFFVAKLSVMSANMVYWAGVASAAWPRYRVLGKEGVCDFCCNVKERMSSTQ